MGVVKYSGPVASFHCSTNAEIRSLKVHFSPKQEGSGDPSPENVRPIIGWDGAVVHNDLDGIIVPEEYQKVEYLENSGTQYIITSYSVNGNISVKWKYSFTANQRGDSMIFGATQNNILGRIQAEYYSHSSWYVSIPGARYRSQLQGVGANLYQVYTGFVDNTALTIDNKSSTTRQDSGQPIQTMPIGIFCWTSNGKPEYINHGVRLYDLLFKNEERITAHFVPCRRKSDNKPGMYDTVSGEFFTNQGTGEFICGPDVGETVEYEFGVLGKNKFNQENEIADVYVDANGDLISYTASSWKGSDYIKVSGNTIYTFNPGSNSGNLAKHCYYDKDKNFISYIDSGLQTFTTPNNAEYMRFSYRGSDTPMLELGSTATAYEPYDPNKTVYGGWVDLVSGEVCEEWYGFIVDGEHYYVQAGIGKETSGTFDGCWKAYNYFGEGGLSGLPAPLRSGSISANELMYFDKFTRNQYVTGIGGIYNIHAGAPYIRIFFDETILADISSNAKVLESMRAYLSKHPIQAVYRLGTPNTYHLAPTSMQTFLSQNNVWSNADYVEVEYDLHETQTILARKQFIIANQPHVEKLAAAPLQNFVTDMAAPLKECKVYFEPKQDLHGYEKPWIGGAGKNLFNYLDPENWRIATTPTARWKEHTEGTITNSNGTVVLSRNSSAGGLALILGELVAETQYTISGIFTNIDNTAYIAKLDTAIADDYTCTRVTTPKFVDGAVSFTPAENGIYELLLWIGGNGDIFARNVQLEEGSTATAYEPWENICPIEGWDGVTIRQTGKNLYDKDKQRLSSDYDWNFIITGDKRKGNTDTNFPRRTFIDIAVPGATYILKTDCYEIGFLDKDENVISWYNGWGTVERTAPIDAAYVYHTWIYNGSLTQEEVDVKNESMTLYYTNAVADNYESYQGTTIPIDWTDEAGTVYGGYVDLITGDVWKTWDVVDLGTCTWIQYSNIPSIFYTRSLNNLKERSSYYTVLCSAYPYEQQEYVTATNDKTINDSQQLNLGNVAIRDTNYTNYTPAEFKEAMNGVICTYKLATPILVTTLTPIQLKTLRGTNNIWASNNGDNIELSYWKH